MVFAFQLKHLFADYPLQSSYMMRKLDPVGWTIPLVAHAGVHAWMTFCFVLGFSYALLCKGVGISLGLALLLGAFDFIMHCIVDRFHSVTMKASDPSKMSFWHSFGVDQFLHHVTDLLTIFILLSV